MTDPDTPPPRAFAQGTGVVLQTVGMVLFLSTCCVCSTSFLWDPVLPPAEAIEQAARRRAPEQGAGWRLSRLVADPGRTSLMLVVMSMTIGGLALASLGLGLQADRRHAAAGAVACVLVLIVVLALAAPGLWRHGGWPARIWHAILFLAMAVLLPMVAAALRQVRRHPPPTDVDVVPPGTKIPYSFYHDDPPEVRLARDIAARKAKLEAEQAELRKMEDELRKSRQE